MYSYFYLVHLKVLPINALGKSMSTKGTKHFPTFYLHFTYKYQQCMSAPQMPCIYLCHAKNSLNWCKIIKIIRSSLCCNISTGFFCEFLLVVMFSVSSISKDVLASVDQSNLIGSFFGPYAIYRLVIYVPSLNVFRSNLRYWKWHYGKQIYPHMRSQFL